MRSTVLLVLALLASTAAWSKCSHPLRFPMQDWPPYLYSDLAGQPAGLDFEILSATVKEAGCTLQVLPPLPGNRMLEMFRKGRLDILLGASKTSERYAYARFTQPYRSEVIGVLSLPGRVNLQEVKSFADILRMRLRLLAPRHGYYGNDYAVSQPELVKQNALSQYDGSEQGLRMLVAGRGQLIMDDELALRYVARQMGVGELQAGALVANRDPVFMMLSQASTSAEDVEALDAALGRLKSSGAIDAIIRRYGPESSAQAGVKATSP